MPDVTLKLKADDQASSKIKGVTGSIISAQVAMQAFRMAAKLAGEAIKLAEKNSVAFKTQSDSLKNSVNGITSVVGKGLGDALSGSVKGINDFIKSGQGLSLISGVISGIATGFRIVGSVVKAISASIIELVKTITSAGATIGSFFEFLAGKKTWDQVKENAKGTTEAFKNIGKGATKEFEVVKKELENLKSEQKKTADAIAASIDASEKESLKKKQDNINKEIAEKEKAAQKEIDLQKKKQDEIDKLAEEAAKKQSERQKQIVDISIASVNTVLNSASSIVGAISDYINQGFEQQITALDENLTLQVDSINENYEEQKELLENDGMTKEEARNKDIENLQQAISKEKNVKNKKALQDKLAEQQKAKALVDLETKKNAELKKAQDEYALKKWEAEVSQFKSNQASQTAQIWIQAAAGFVGAMAQGISQLGPIAGSILGGIAGAALLAVAGVQTGIIWSQSPPPRPFAEGGIVPGGQVMVGERGRELVNLPAGSEVINNTMTERMIGQSGGDIFVSVFLDSAQMPIERILTENRRYELART